MNNPRVDGDTGVFLISPDSSQVVYLAKPGTDEVPGLFSVPLLGDELPTRLNEDLVVGGQIYWQFQISPDSSRVVYLHLADQETDWVNELYSVPLTGDAPPVKLNGELVVDNVVLENYWERDKPIYPTGQIELQNHGNTLYFRNIYIREITNVLNDQETTDGFKLLFNGKDLNGWQGNTKGYVARDCFS